jgi:hypothetical protein
VTRSLGALFLVLGGRKTTDSQQSKIAERGGGLRYLEAILPEGRHRIQVELEVYEECVLSVAHQVLLSQGDV